MNDFLAIYGEQAYHLQKKYLGDCVGWYVSMDVGQLNQVVHMWRFKDFNDRDERRKQLAADPDWPDYLKAATPLIQHMENKILSYAPFYEP
jgi:hypothetical protein